MVLGLILGLAYQEYLQKRALAYLAEQIEQQTGYRVDCGQITFTFPLYWHVDHLSLSSSEGEILLVEDLEAHISPWEWLHQHAVFDSIKIKKLTIPTGVKTTTPFSWEAIPWYCNVELLEIDELYLGEPVLAAIGMKEHPSFLSPAIPLRVAAYGVLSPHKKDIFLDMTLSKAFAKKGQTHFIASLTQDSAEQQLKLHVRIAESPEGMISEFLSLPEEYSYQGILEVAGPSNTWDQLVNAGMMMDAEMLTGDLQLNYESIIPDHPSIALLGNYGTVKSLFSFSKRHLKFSDIEGLVGPMLLKGKCTLSPEGNCIDTAIQLSIDETSYAAVKLRDSQVDMVFSGSIFAPNTSLKLSAESIDFPSHQFENVTMQGTCAYASDMVSTSAKIHCQHKERDWTLAWAAEWNPQNEILGIPHLSIASENTEIVGQLQADLKQNLMFGDMAGQADLSILKQWLPIESDGMVFLKAHFDPHHDTSAQSIDLNLRSNSLYCGPISAKQADLNITIENPLDSPSALIQLTCDKAAWKEVSASKIRYETVINLSAIQWPFSLSCEQGMLQIHSQGSWHHSPRAIDLQFDTLKGALDTFPFVLQDPVHLVLEPNRFDLSPVFFSIGTGLFYASADSSTGYMHGVARIQHIPIDIIRLFYPDVPAKGLIDASATINETPAGVIGDLHVELNGIDFKAGPLSPPAPLKGFLSADLHDNLLTCSGEMTGMGLQPVILQGTLPVNLSISPFKAAIDSTKSMNARIKAEGKIESLLEFLLPVTTTNLAGHTSFVIDVKGTPEAPQISGQVILSNGTFELLGVGASVHNVNAQIAIKGTKATLTQLTAQGKNNGTITGMGTAELSPSSAFPFDLSFQLNQITFEPSSYANVIASGPLRFRGNLEGRTLEGKLVSDSISVSIPEQIPELGHSMEITYVNQPKGIRPPTARTAAATPDLPLAYHLELEIPKHCMLRGQDWSSEWKGSALLTGTSDNPLLNGSCKVIKGAYRFNGKSFEINEGTISFAGDPKKKTTLYVIASKDIETIHVEVIAKGSVTDPAIVFRSNPPMSQREILSWILFNRGVSEITKFQGTQLNESITNLSKGNRQPDVLTKIRDRIGIDKIDICRSQDSDSNAVSVQVGKYVSQGVLVSIHKSITDEANRLSIEADLIKHFKIQAEVGDDADGQLRLKWKKDY